RVAATLASSARISPSRPITLASDVSSCASSWSWLSGSSTGNTLLIMLCCCDDHTTLPSLSILSRSTAMPCCSATLVGIVDRPNTPHAQPPANIARSERQTQSEGVLKGGRRHHLPGVEPVLYV